MMAWQWHQLDHIEIICTSLQTDNHTSTSSFSFYTPDALPAAQPNCLITYICKPDITARYNYLISLMSVSTVWL